MQRVEGHVRKLEFYPEVNGMGEDWGQVYVLKGFKWGDVFILGVSIILSAVGTR